MFHFGTESKSSSSNSIKFSQRAVLSEMHTHIVRPIRVEEEGEDDIVVLSQDEKNSPPKCAKNLHKSENSEKGLKRRRSEEEEDKESDFNFSDTSSLLSKSVKAASTNRKILYNIDTFFQPMS